MSAEVATFAVLALREKSRIFPWSVDMNSHYTNTYSWPPRKSVRGWESEIVLSFRRFAVGYRKPTANQLQVSNEASLGPFPACACACACTCEVLEIYLLLPLLSTETLSKHYPITHGHVGAAVRYTRQCLRHGSCPGDLWSRHPLARIQLHFTKARHPHFLLKGIGPISALSHPGRRKQA